MSRRPFHRDPASPVTGCTTQVGCSWVVSTTHRSGSGLKEKAHSPEREWA